MTTLPPSLTRRRMLSAMAALTLAPARLRAQAWPRLAVIDWAMLETVLALGVLPVAASELIQYRRLVITPPLPDGVVDLGLRGTPNYELLRMTTPDTILISNFYEAKRAVLERIAPVVSLPVYRSGQAPFPLAAQAMRTLGERFGRTDAAARFTAETESEFMRLRSRLAAFGRPVFIISLGDARHFRAFGVDSMFGDVAGRLGLVNAWTEATSYSAAAPVGIEALARQPDAVIVTVAPIPPEARQTLRDNAVWNALPAVRAGRVKFIDPVNHFGGLPAARRFAVLLGTALTGSAAND